MNLLLRCGILLLVCPPLVMCLTKRQVKKFYTTPPESQPTSKLRYSHTLVTHQKMSLGTIGGYVSLDTDREGSHSVQNSELTP
jgi:hypothetical protein